MWYPEVRQAGDPAWRSGSRRYKFYQFMTNNLLTKKLDNNFIIFILLCPPVLSGQDFCNNEDREQYSDTYKAICLSRTYYQRCVLGMF